MSKKLSGKVALIADGDQEMAQTIALDLAASGATIVIRSQRPVLSSLKPQIEELGSKCLLIEGPFNNDVLIKTIEEFGHLDILVNTMSPKKRVKDDTSTICLSMIVKNEVDVIERCLNSVKPFIDYWVIVDTGSTDGTQELINKCMEGIPGELHEREWVDFATNRNQSLEIAKSKGDYILFIDADNILTYSDSFFFSKPDKNAYLIKSISGQNEYITPLVRSNLSWVWIGIMHEALFLKDPGNFGSYEDYPVLEGITRVSLLGGARAKDPDKYKKDAEILEQAIIKEPNNSRHVFYLGTSYKNHKDYEKAIIAFEKRATMSHGKGDEESYYSLLNVAVLQDKLKKDPKIIEENYKKALLYRPSRHETYYHLARFYMAQHDFAKAYSILLQSLRLPKTSDILIVESWVHDYGLLSEFVLAAYKEKQYTQSFLAAKLVLTNPGLPEELRSKIQKILDDIIKVPS